MGDGNVKTTTTTTTTTTTPSTIVLPSPRLNPLLVHASSSFSRPETPIHLRRQQEDRPGGGDRSGGTKPGRAPGLVCRGDGQCRCWCYRQHCHRSGRCCGGYNYPCSSFVNLDGRPRTVQPPLIAINYCKTTGRQKSTRLYATTFSSFQVSRQHQEQQQQLPPRQDKATPIAVRSAHPPLAVVFPASRAGRPRGRRCCGTTEVFSHEAPGQRENPFRVYRRLHKTTMTPVMYIGAF